MSMKKVKQDWPGHVQAIKTLGISTSAYAQQHGLARSTLYRWQHKLKSAPSIDADTNVAPLQATPKSSKFVALRISETDCTTPPAPVHCTLVLAFGIRLEMSELPNPQWLADLGRCSQGAP